MSLGVDRATLHQAIAIVKDQISVDFDITSIKLVGLQVDFSNQKIKSRCEEATGGFSASVSPFTDLKTQIGESGVLQQRACALAQILQ
jgi:hypothetical protein